MAQKQALQTRGSFEAGSVFAEKLEDTMKLKNFGEGPHPAIN